LFTRMRSDRRNETNKGPIGDGVRERRKLQPEGAKIKENLGKRKRSFLGGGEGNQV